MRLLILHLATVFGGAERTTSNLIDHLDRDLVRHVTVAAPAALKPLLPFGIDAFVDTSVSIRQGWILSPATLFHDVKAAARIVQAAKPDLVLGMMHYPAALAVLGVRLGRLPVKTIGSYRGPVFEHMRRYEHGWKRKLFLGLVVGATARLADRMIVPSEGTAQELRQRFLGSKKRTLVIPNGIDASRARRAAAEPASELERLPGHLPRICVAARLSVEKDIGLLLEAYRRSQEAQGSSLIIVGDGPDRSRLERQVQDWCLAERVLFLGHKENVYPYIAGADLYVHTCQFEGFGYTILEAMACGTSVIATDCPYGPREIIGDNHYGMLVPMEDPEALARSIVELLATPELRQHFAAQGAARADQLSIGRMVRGYEAVFRDLVPG